MNLSVLRDRRSANQSQGREQSFLVFTLGSEQFAVSLLAVQKVTMLSTVFGDPQRSGISLTIYEGQELAVIDVQRRILNQSTDSDRQVPPDLDGTPQYLVVVQNSRQEMMGLPTDSKPKIKAFPEQSLKPLPTAYQNDAAIQCVSNLVIQDQEQPIFLLNPELVCQSLNPNYIPADSVNPEQITELEQLLKEESSTTQPRHQAPQLVVDATQPAAEGDIDWMSLTLEGLDLPEAPADPSPDLRQGMEFWQAPEFAVNPAIALDTEAIDWEAFPLGDFDTALAVMDPAGQSLPDSDPIPNDAAIAPDVSSSIDWASLPLDNFEPANIGADLPSQPESADDSEIAQPLESARVNVANSLNDDGEIDWAALPIADFNLSVETVMVEESDSTTSPSSHLFPALDEPLDWDNLPLDGFEIAEQP